MSHNHEMRALSLSEVIDGVWCCDAGGGSAVLRVYVGALPRKLRDAGARALIDTVHGVDYVLREL